jgi:hypothetical protein
MTPTHWVYIGGFLINLAWTVLNMRTQASIAEIGRQMQAGQDKAIAEVKEWANDEFVLERVCLLRHGEAHGHTR